MTIEARFIVATDGEHNFRRQAFWKEHTGWVPAFTNATPYTLEEIKPTLETLRSKFVDVYAVDVERFTRYHAAWLEEYVRLLNAGKTGRLEAARLATEACCSIIYKLTL